MNWMHTAVLLFGVTIGWVVNGWRLNGDIADMKLDIANQAETLRLAAQKRINTAGTQFAEKAAKDRVIVQTKIVEVEKYVSPNDCPLSPGFRVLYDSAVTGEEISDTARTNASAVSAQDVARTTVENFAACRYDKQRLEALQAIVRVSECFDSP